MQYVAPNAMDNVYISLQASGSAVITHFANSTANKTYKYIIVG
jgi:DNA topoisomerase IB